MAILLGDDDDDDHWYYWVRRGRGRRSHDGLVGIIIIFENKKYLRSPIGKLSEMNQRRAAFLPASCCQFVFFACTFSIVQSLAVSARIRREYL